MMYVYVYMCVYTFIRYFQVTQGGEEMETGRVALLWTLANDACLKMWM